MNLYLYFPNFVADLGEICVGNLHILLLSICEFCENDYSGKLYFTEGCK